MTIGSEDEFEQLKTVGRLVARTLNAMAARLEPGITTAELDRGPVVVTLADAA
jgi:methionyl aminopeptidase